MRRARRSGGFFLCLLLNLFLNPEGMIPAAILLVLHFWLGLVFLVGGACAGALDPLDNPPHTGPELGKPLRKHAGPTDREQKPLFSGKTGKS